MHFDPRTTLLALLALNMLAMGNHAFSVCVVGLALVAVLLLAARQVRQAMIAVATFAFCASMYLIPLAVGAPSGFTGLTSAVMAMGFWFARFTVSIGAGYWAVQTIRPAELIDSLHQIHAPNWLVVPLAVVLRIFPVIATETRAVVDAMTLRGLRPGPAGMLRHPVKTGELVLIPLLMTVVRAGDELAAAAMIRGLGGPHRPSSLRTPRFRLADALLLIALAAITALALSGWEIPL
ncbi:energy-coupling factor transporter transmembrane component T [Gephyromycinifex aptenodytis]|uniref:energy-coupling factor transporter transmembrane component T n=1 Tax=Gephyromycinifex aptenodytis TaxID=2716227 RepID=UPI0014482890|nr:energy-coupling factor transporter transmembrane component T [Gephyromycinifex aptenodytis]